MLRLTICTEEDSFTSDKVEIKRFLADEGIEFGGFELSSRTKELVKAPVIDDKDRPGLVLTYPKLIANYSELPGYRADVICMSPDMSYLDFILKSFKDIHYHYENEYWYVIDGSCGYGYLGQNGRKFIVTLPAGYFISVPEKKWQWILPPADKKMKAMRFFNTSNTVPKPDQLVFA